MLQIMQTPALACRCASLPGATSRSRAPPRAEWARVWPQHQRRQRTRALVLLVVMCALVTQMSWGCHAPSFPPQQDASNDAAIAALIASAYCGTGLSPAEAKTSEGEPSSHTLPGSLCLHCTTSTATSAGLATGPLIALDAGELVPLRRTTRAENATAWHTPPARAPPPPVLRRNSACMTHPFYFQSV